MWLWDSICCSVTNSDGLLVLPFSFCVARNKDCLSSGSHGWFRFISPAVRFEESHPIIIVPCVFLWNPCSNGSAHYETWWGVTVSALLHTGLLSVHARHPTILPKSKATVAFGGRVTFALWRGYNQRQLGNSILEFLLQWMRASKDWLPMASSLCPVFFGAGCWMVTIHLRTSPPGTHRIYGLHVPVVELACGIFLPRACGCLELCVYISRATVWKLREQTDSKEFTGQTTVASSFRGLIYI